MALSILHKDNYIDAVLGLNFLALILFTTLQNVVCQYKQQDIQSIDVSR